MQAHQRLPSLNALRAFEAVARRLSFARAAEELFVTKAAVAQQIRLLEEEIGAPIVERSGRGLRLTEAGAAGAAALTDGFAMLARAARAMREAKGRSFLVVNASASFAATWLVGRIGRFKARHPDIDVLLDADPREDSLERGGADAMVSWGDGAFPGLSTTRLFKEEVFPVCSPKLVAAEPPLTTPSDLARFTLLHLEWNPSFPTWPSWSDWLKAAGAGEVEATRGVFFNQMSMAIAAAAHGQGVALASLAIAADDLASARLVAPFATTVRTPFGYYFLCRPEAAETPRIRALRDFLVEEAALSSA
jgi:LysR family transcriptional regulator, glycine cleavage system transcriptional activator